MNETEDKMVNRRWMWISIILMIWAQKGSVPGGNGRRKRISLQIPSCVMTIRINNCPVCGRDISNEQ